MYQQGDFERFQCEPKTLLIVGISSTMQLGPKLCTIREQFVEHVDSVEMF